MCEGYVEPQQALASNLPVEGAPYQTAGYWSIASYLPVRARNQVTCAQVIASPKELLFQFSMKPIAYPRVG